MATKWPYHYGNGYGCYSAHDLLLAYDINDWVLAPADEDNQQPNTHHTTNPNNVPNETYPQHTEWVPDATQDGDLEPNPGPDNNTSPHGTVRTLTENFEKSTSGHHREVRHLGDVEETTSDKFTIPT